MTTSAAASLRRRGLDDWITLVLLGASLGLNVFLGLQLRHPRIAPSSRLKIGLKLPRVEADDAAGKRTVIDWGREKRPTLLYIFAPSCVWCNRNLENIDVLADSVKGKYTVIGVSLSKDGLSQYIRGHNVRYAVYSGLDKVNGNEILSSATPTTLVIDLDGTVKKMWSGFYSAPVKRDLELTFGVTLP